MSLYPSPFCLTPTFYKATELIHRSSVLRVSWPSASYYPSGILSIGWTTTANPELGYTPENIDAMLALCKDLPEVTFPVRACLLPNSGTHLQRLIKNKEGYTLTVWNNEPVSNELRDWIKTDTDPAKTFYDFIDENKDPLKLW